MIWDMWVCPTMVLPPTNEDKEMVGKLAICRVSIDKAIIITIGLSSLMVPGVV